MSHTQNVFEGFFEDPLYLALKNHLYNYLRRRDAVRKRLQYAAPAAWTLEIGSGVSPITQPGERVVYVDLSWRALAHLKRHHPVAHYIVMSAHASCFKAGSISTVVMSEVLEHIQDDTQVLREVSWSLAPRGAFIATVPAHMYFFAFDDRFVGHYRRYEVQSFRAALEAQRFDVRMVQPVCGLLERCATWALVRMFALLPHRSGIEKVTVTKSDSHFWGQAFIPRFILHLALIPYLALNHLFAWCLLVEACLTPQALASILLFDSQKSDSH